MKIVLLWIALLLFWVGAAFAEVAPAQGEQSFCGKWTTLQVKLGHDLGMVVSGTYLISEDEIVAIMNNSKDQWSMWMVYNDGMACFIVEGKGLYLGEGA